MLRTLAVLVLLLLLASTAAPQGKSKFWLRGAWEGTGYQTDDNSTWPMRLTITKRKGRRTYSIDYPSLSCGGRWKLLSINQSKARFREQLDHGQDKCTDNGQVVIERIGRRQLIFLYSNQGSREITASAVLNRKKPSSNR
jgi:hypothetical protein